MQKIKFLNVIIFLLIFGFTKKTINIISKNKLNVETPKITVVIPIYNGGKYLNYSLKSVQNQKMKDIEIIIVDDNSNDDSLKIIQNYMKIDKRIKLIKNMENRKILFCKSFGVLNSKGKYIIEIDQDDKFIRNDAFDFIYNESEKYSLDLLNFKYISGYNIAKIPKIKNNRKVGNIFETQHNLKFSIFKKNRIVLWGNLIRADLYKKIIYNLWPIIINYNIIFQEDFLITFFLLIYAKKFEKIKHVFYYHFINRNSASHDFKNNSEYYLSVIFIGIIYYDYYIDYNSIYIQNIINYIYFLKRDFMKIKSLFPNLFNYFFFKILSNKRILLKNKKVLMKDFNISEKLFSDSHMNISIIPKKELNILKKESEIINISIIVICNEYEKTINLINSINNQNYKYLEIILIYDHERKLDFNLLGNYIKSFEFIKIVDNKYKRGIIHSIFNGVSISKGKYIMILNQNCFFINDDSLKNIHEEIQKDDADILEIDLYTIFQNKYKNLYKCKHFKTNYKFTKIKYNLDFNDIDIKNDLLINKLFKIKYFRNVINNFKADYLNKVIDHYYNNIFNFIIFSTSHKFKHIFSASIYINEADTDKYIFNDFNSKNNQTIEETLLYINFIFDYSEDSFEDKEKVLKEFFNVLSIIFNKFTKISESSLNLFDKFMKCKYFSKEKKDLLKFYFDSLIN